MILEHAILNIKRGQSEQFEAAFRDAAFIISGAPGYFGHELHKCVEAPDRYLLLAWWDTLEAHTVGFRGSQEYQEWTRRLHHFYEPFPTVEHYVEVDLGLDEER